MKRYDAFEAGDPFAAAVSAFDCLMGALAEPQAGVLAHHELEDLIEVQGREAKVLSKRQAEQLVVAAAGDIDVFYRQRMPLPATADTLLVMQFDSKGIVMRPEALRPDTLKAHQRARPGDAHPADAGLAAAPQADGGPGLRLRRRSRTATAARHHRPA